MNEGKLHRLIMLNADKCEELPGIVINGGIIKSHIQFRNNFIVSY